MDLHLYHGSPWLPVGVEQHRRLEVQHPHERSAAMQTSLPCRWLLVAAVAVALLWQLVPLWQLVRLWQTSLSYPRLCLRAVALRLPHWQRQLVPPLWLFVAVTARVPHCQRQLVPLWLLAPTGRQQPEQPLEEPAAAEEAPNRTYTAHTSNPCNSTLCKDHTSWPYRYF